MRNKRGQLTIFIIIAIVVVALALLLFLIIPNFNFNRGAASNPQQYIDTCVREELEENIETISMQGGEWYESDPEAYYRYDGYSVRYLCYTSRYYEFCNVQVPFLKDHVEEEIKSSIENTVDYCFDSLKSDYEDKGYNVDLEAQEIKVDILSEVISVSFNRKLTLQKGEDSEEYKDFQINIQSNLYKFLSIARSIVEWESELGTAEPDLYMDAYHDTIVLKLNQDDETTVYVIKDDKNKFQMASRSLAFPPGYGELGDYE